MSEPGGGVEERRFGFGALEQEQHQGLGSAVVASDVVAGVVASVAAQPLGYALRRDGAAFVLQQAPVPVALVTQLERGVGVEDVAAAALPVCDLRAVGGEQVEQLVVGVAGGFGREPGGELGDASLVIMLGSDGAQVGAEVHAIVVRPLRRPAVEGGADCGAVADAFTVRVKVAPVVASYPDDMTDLEAGTSREISLAGVFTDADGDALTITARSDNAAAAAVSVAADGSALTLEGVSAGEATVTVSARDPDGNPALVLFDVRVLLPLALDPASEAASTLEGVAGRYDANGDGRIDYDEYLQATRDYDAGELTILEVLQIRRAYQAGQG